MSCYRCGSSNRRQARFCRHCGALLTRTEAQVNAPSPGAARSVPLPLPYGQPDAAVPRKSLLAGLLRW